MRGWYDFTTTNGQRFRSRIPLFFLNQNNMRH
jgi:uncharacterized protein affecting Mg2+/Co2+ transport